MKSEVVVKVESPESEEAILIDGLSGGEFKTAGTLETSSLVELGEERHIRAIDDGKKKENKNKRKKEIYPCRFCEKTFDKGQALGGHMNGHPEARNQEKMREYAKLLQKMHSSSFRSVNLREYVSDTSSYPLNNFNQTRNGYNTITPMLPIQPTMFIQQQPPHQMDPSQAWPGDSQQFSWPQASTIDINFRGPPNVDFPEMPNLYTYADSDTTVNGNYGPPSMDPSMSGLTSQYSAPSPSSMPSKARYGNVASCDLCNLSDSQMNMHSLHTQQGTNSNPILQRNQPGLSVLSNLNDSSSVQHAQSSFISGMGNQEMGVSHVSRKRPNPSNASETGSNPMIKPWSGNPTSHLF